MDYFLSTHWQASRGLLLGKVFVGKLSQSRASRPVLAPFISAGTVWVYKVSGWEATLCCDNLRALQLSSQDRRRIKPSAASFDLHRSLRSTKNNFTGCIKYQHVARYVDKYLLWHQLSLVQQLNCMCDTTAKGAVQRAITTGYISTPTQMLPQEDVAIVIWGNKITSDVSHPVFFFWKWN